MSIAPKNGLTEQALTAARAEGAAMEREACAMIADAHGKCSHTRRCYSKIADAIRARGAVKPEPVEKPTEEWRVVTEGLTEDGDRCRTHPDKPPVSGGDPISSHADMGCVIERRVPAEPATAPEATHFAPLPQHIIQKSVKLEAIVREFSGKSAFVEILTPDGPEVRVFDRPLLRQAGICHENDAFTMIFEERHKPLGEFEAITRFLPLPPPAEQKNLKNTKQ